MEQEHLLYKDEYESLKMYILEEVVCFEYFNEKGEADASFSIPKKAFEKASDIYYASF